MLPGGLLVTRSFGDFNSKLEYLGGKKGVVISTHGRISYINAGKTPPKYLILASDGVWDVLTIQEVSQMLDTFLEKRALLGPATSSNCQPLPTDTAAATSAAGPTAPSGVKLSPHKVYPETAQPSHADLSEAQSTFQQVHSELINARYSDLSADLNEAATFIVKCAAASPKWKALGEKHAVFFAHFLRSYFQSLTAHRLLHRLHGRQYIDDHRRLRTQSELRRLRPGDRVRQ
jgi:hypothetical protein